MGCSAACGLTPAAGEPVDLLTPEAKVCFSELQSGIQLRLLIAAFVAVPFLLLPIPFIEMYEHSKASKGGHSKIADDDDEPVAGGGGHGDHGEEFSMGDAFI